MATPFVEPKIQISDANGAPLSGGKVYTYEAGTTTPKATYTDAAAGTQNANPVILDSAGRANIWGSGTYRVIVKDSSDVTIYDIDNFTSYTATTSNTFSDTSFTLQDDGDSTKQAKFECSGLSAGTIRTFTFPNATTTLVGSDTTQDLSNKNFVDATDATKKMTFSMSGITTATTRTITVPDANITLVGLDATQTLTNKSLSDSTTYFVDNADTTKKLQLQCSGITTGTTRTMTVPDNNFTVVGEDTTQTLTNKKITAANIKTFTVTLADDTATSFTPTTSGGEARGIILIKSSTENTCAGIGWYNCAGGAMASFFAQADLNILATNTTLAGTTSTDAKLNVSAASDGKIYIENRRGGSETYEVTIF